MPHLTYYQQLMLKEANEKPYKEFDGSVSQQIKGLVKRGLLKVIHHNKTRIRGVEQHFIKVQVTEKGKQIVSEIISKGVKKQFKYQ